LGVLALLALLSQLPAAQPVHAQTQFDLTGDFNVDIILNTGDAANDGADASGNKYITLGRASAPAIGCPTPSGLPDDGFFAANAQHPEVQLAYSDGDSGDNAWQALNTGGTINVDVPDAMYSEVHVFAASGDGVSSMSVTFNYTTGVPFIDGGPVGDWVTGGGADYTLIGSMDIADGTDVCDDQDNRAIYGFVFEIDPTRVLASIDIIRIVEPNSIAILNVFGALGVTDEDEGEEDDEEDDEPTRTPTPTPTRTPTPTLTPTATFQPNLGGAIAPLFEAGAAARDRRATATAQAASQATPVAPMAPVAGQSPATVRPPSTGDGGLDTR
jgi:hypothetical protein